MKSWMSLLGTGIVLGLGIMLVGWQIMGQSYQYQGSLIETPLPAAGIELIDQYGNPYRLVDQRGQIVLIFFGYTNCPDVCPLSLADFRQIKAQLGNQAENIEFLFITVDPDRDTSERLKLYVNSFDPDFVGLTGPLDALEKVFQSYGVYRAKVETGSASGYTMDHTARMYLIDPQGNWRLTYPFGFEIDKVVADLQHMLRED